MRVKLFALLIILVLLPFIGLPQTKYVSVQDGYWYRSSTWSPNGVPGINDTAVIKAGTKVTVRPNLLTSQDSFNVAKLIVEEEATLAFDNINFFNWFYRIPKLSVWDTLKNNGTINGDLIGDFPSLTDRLTPIYANKSLTGTGNFSIMSLRFNNNTTIEPEADLSLSYSFVRVRPDVTVTNYGKFSTDFIIRADGTNSTWINKENSVVSVGFTLMAGGRLICNETGNTVKYLPIYGNISITVPVDTIYYNLETGGTDTVIYEAPYLYINNNILISGSVFRSDNNKLYVRGNWTDYGDFFSNNSTVIFDGSQDQTITASSIETFENLVLDNSPNKIILASDIVVNDTLNLNTIVQSNLHNLTIGESASNIGYLKYQSGKILGKVSRWITANTNAYFYPIGTADFNTFVNVTFPSLTSAGIASFEFINSAPGSNGLPLRDGPGDTVYNPFNDGYWVADTSAGFKLGANTYSIALQGKIFNAFTINDSTKIIVRPHPDSLWRFDGIQGTNNPTNYIVARKDLDSFPWQFAFADTTNCSPPTLTVINGPADVCRADAGVEYITDTSSTNTFYWTVSGGLVAQDKGDTVLIDWDNNGGYATISVYAENACTFGNTISKTVRVHSIPPSDFYGPVTVPEYYDSVMYRIDALNNYTYTYTGLGGAVVDSVYPTQDTTLISFTAAGEDSIMIVAKYSSCPSDTAYFPIHVYDVINSVRSGSWFDYRTWDCKCRPLKTDNVRIRAGHDVKIDQYTLNGITYIGYDITNVVVEAGGSLTRQDGYLDISGDVINNGTITYQSSNLHLLGNDKTIGGIGTFIVDTLDINGNRKITPDASLTVSGSIKIGSNKLTNSGKLTVTKDITASTGTFVNDKFSELKIKGNFFPNGGELIADSTENTIIYKGGTQSVIPVSTASNGYYNLIIGGDGTKTASGDLIVLGDFMIQDTGVFDISNKNITIYRNWNEFSVASNPFIEGTGTVLFNGSGDQYIYAPYGETFYDMKIGQNSTLNIMPNQHFTVSNNLYIDGKLKMLMQKSNDTLPSFIYNNDIIYGTNGTVETDLFMQNKTWTEISPAITGLTSATFTRAISTNYNPNFYWYDESIDLDGNPTTEPAGDYDDSKLAAGWKYAHNGSGGADVPLSINRGYLFYIDRDMTISMEGKVAKVSVVYDTTLSFTPNDPDNDADTLPNLYDGWNLIGNPYTAYLSIDSILKNATNVDNGVYVWDDSKGQYAGYQNGFRIMAGTLGNIIPPLQGFFVRANAAGASLKIRPEYRTHGKQMFIKSTPVYNPKQNAVKLGFAANGKIDYFAAYTSPEAKEFYNGKLDMLYKYATTSGVPHLYSDKNDVPIALYSIPDTFTNYVLPLYVKIDNDDTYQIKTAFINGLYDKFVMLKDLKTQQIYNLREFATVNFDYSTQDSAHRFDLLFVQNHPPQLIDSISALKAYEDSLFEFNVKPYFNDIDQYDSLVFLIEADTNLNWLSISDSMLVGVPAQRNIGTYRFTVIAKDMLGFKAQQVVNIDVYNTNDAPVCNYQLEEVSVVANDTLYYQIPTDLFSDPDPNDQLTITVENLPQWLSFDAQNLLIKGVPSANDVGTYNIKIIATDLDSAQVSTTLTVKVQLANGIQTINDNHVNIYPNPATDKLNISLEQPVDNGIISIYTTSGQLVKQRVIDNDLMTIGIMDLPSGQYIIRIKNGDKLYQLKFTKL